MKWFKHDSNASSDAKIKKLLIRHGAVGYAVYFHCLELIAGNVSNENITFELEHDSEIIADNLRIRGTNDKSGVEIVEEIMRYIIDLELFENNSGRITCFKMIKRLDSSMTSNPKFRKLILEAKEHHELLDESHDSNKESHDTVKSSADTIMISDQKVMQEQNRIEQNRKEENIILAQRDESPCAVFTLPRLNSDEFPITQDQIDIFSEAYPAVDVLGELKRMKAWLLANKKNQKKDVLKFANNWLSRTQDQTVRAMPSRTIIDRQSNDRFAHDNVDPF